MVGSLTIVDNVMGALYYNIMKSAMSYARFLITAPSDLRDTGKPTFLNHVLNSP